MTNNNHPELEHLRAQLDTANETIEFLRTKLREKRVEELQAFEVFKPLVPLRKPSRNAILDAMKRVIA